MTSTDDFHSPESTVTSLLASSGQLKSSSSSDLGRSIRYRDREYESASEALDAYIADFQRSLRTPEVSTGRLQLPKDPVPPILSRTRFRNKDVLRERLTDGELDFLNLPVGPQRREPDSVSLTTDDLLILPTDGSMPITRTSAYLTQHLAYHSSTSRSLRSQDLLASQGASQRRRAQGRAPGGEDFLGSHPNRQPRRSHQTQRGPPDAGSSSHYPRWLTSLKSDMDFSGVTSIPDQTYPTWLRDCEETAGRKSAFDDRIESLILKAEKALESSHHAGKAGGCSPRTEDILDLDRSWDNPPVTFKPPVPVGGAEDQLNVNKPGGTREIEAAASTSSGYSSRKHPGPVEALKQMLFSLQAVEQRVTQRQEGKLQDTSTPETQHPGPPEEHLLACSMSDPCEDYENAPGGQSLQRALLHLGRLKNLVEDMNERERASGVVTCENTATL
ncbi:lung adenoma susceptibility protein 2 isoform X2 [Conger conger]|uniref:lung adenoma susceptibility protein 2 isoform X2 n=1 Tax=Conger conger TaxID=82655 RepID=UPI002A5A6F29|nr:lung adenoma susceptibility protein 2 isoform X2 [Conger conger]